MVAQRLPAIYVVIAAFSATACATMPPSVSKPSTSVNTPIDRGQVQPAGDAKLPALDHRKNDDLPEGVVPNRVDVPDYDATVIRFGRSEVADILLPTSGAVTRRPTVWPVVIYKDDLSPSSAKVVGNGILFNRDVVLTARHVAAQIQLAPNRYRLELYSLQDSSILKRQVLEYSRVVTLDRGDDPDLACIMLKAPSSVQFDSLPVAPTAAVRDSIYVIGAGAFGDVPRLGLGHLFALPTKRCIELWCITVAGTNLFRFEGLSGSPVFSRTDGSLYGILVAGDKELRPLGEKVARAPGDSAAWPRYADWTWVTPVGPWLAEIDEVTRRAR